MRAVALHADVIVFVSDAWQTTCTAVRGGDEGFVIDSPIYPEELRALPDVLEQAEFPVSGLLATHGDWDHLLGRLAYPGGALGAAESTVARIGAEMGEAQRQLRAFDEQHYVPDRPPLALGSLQALPVPGRLEIGTRPPTPQPPRPPTPQPPRPPAEPSAPQPPSGESAHELELITADGHTADGVAFWMEWANVLVCGDYVSPVEIPMISPGGSVTAYRATLARLSPVMARAEWVVPGHGAPLARVRAQELLAEDDAYLAALAANPARATPPASRGRTTPQQTIHAQNVEAVATP